MTVGELGICASVGVGSRSTVYWRVIPTSRSTPSCTPLPFKSAFLRPSLACCAGARVLRTVCLKSRGKVAFSALLGSGCRHGVVSVGIRVGVWGWVRVTSPIPLRGVSARGGRVARGGLSRSGARPCGGCKVSLKPIESCESAARTIKGGFQGPRSGRSGSCV